LRAELAKWNIPVVNIMPGAMHTPVFSKAQAAFERSLQDVPSAKRSLYASMIRGASAAIAKQRESNPQIAARSILHAIESNRPKKYYLPGSDAKLIAWVLRFLPANLRDKMLSGAMGIR